MNLGVYPNHDDVVVEINWAQMELFPDFWDFACRKAKPFFQGRLAIMFSQSELVSTPNVMNSNSMQLSALEHAIVNSFADVEPTDAFKFSLDSVISNTHQSISVHNESVGLSSLSCCGVLVVDKTVEFQVSVDGFRNGLISNVFIWITDAFECLPNKECEVLL